MLAILALLFGSSVAAYAYWDNLQQNTNSSFDIANGMKLEIPQEIKDTRSLVPVNSSYATYEADYATSYIFTYTLSLEDALQAGMQADLTVNISDFQIGGVLEMFDDASRLLAISVGTDEAIATESDTGKWNFKDAFYFNNNTVIVTVTITLAENVSLSQDEIAINKSTDQITDFTIGFELTKRKKVKPN